MQPTVSSGDNNNDVPLNTSSVYPDVTRGISGAPAPLAEENTKIYEPSKPLGQQANDQPTPVVKVLSVRGVEYFMMTIALWLSASGLLWALLALVNNASSFQVMVFPISFLVVCLPIFIFFYIRLRKVELANPELRFDPSKRRMSQITQILAFIACVSNTIAFVYIVLSKISGESKASLGKSFINLLLVLLIAGGILAYYWFDEHREFNRG